ncbi:Aldo-keto reductase YhdN [Dyadobacter sp. CECT 9275]|uniref:Aldo-keto reductase YhdN n=1 Tax=Dyadobacter helix TaxID=2822344 RepID=A0A916ND71_9BACT|nr:aldo/keto reductase [Dyadobacter sp. CECT 9275]CAG5006307.1 Aldo-keto reductase YhdN [Dyadobacter sp. CECT 9275]
MQYRRFGRTGWEVSEIGYGMWGLAGWSGSDRKETDDSLDLAVESGVNFFDTAWGYGEGLSERILGDLIRRNAGKKIYAATKIPPKNRQWPSRPEFTLDEVFPADYIVEYTEKSLHNLGLEQIDLLQFHVWEDTWAERDEWKEAIQKLTREGKVARWGISINRWEPGNALKTLETGCIDAVQVIYNIFDQAPEDNLFPLCRKMDIGVIARVPFDEGTLTGTLTKETTFPVDDWRSTYFVPENLDSSVDHAEALREDIPAGMTMPELALRFILNNPDVHTTIPGMRKLPHVRANVAVSDGTRLDQALADRLKHHRWDRSPTEWSQ